MKFFSLEFEECQRLENMSAIEFAKEVEQQFQRETRTNPLLCRVLEVIDRKVPPGGDVRYKAALLCFIEAQKAKL